MAVWDGDRKDKSEYEESAPRVIRHLLMSTIKTTEETMTKTQHNRLKTLVKESREEVSLVPSGTNFRHGVINRQSNNIRLVSKVHISVHIPGTEAFRSLLWGHTKKVL